MLLLAVLAIQIVVGAASAGFLVALRDLLEDLATVDVAGATLGIIVVCILSAVSATGPALQDRLQILLAQSVSNASTRRIMRTCAAMDTEDMERPDFQEWMRRAYGAALTRPVTVAGAIVSAMRSLISLVLLGAVVLAMSPLVLAMVILSRCLAWSSTLHAVRSAFRLWRSIGPLERFRGYVVGVFSSASVLRELRLYGTTELMVERHTALSREVLHEHSAELRRISGPAIFSTVTSAFATALTYGGIGHLALTGQVGLATAAALMFAVPQVAGSVAGLLGSITTIYESALYMEDARGFIRPSAPERFEEQMPLREVQQLKAEHISFTYPQVSGEPAFSLRDISLTLERGQIVAVVGPNGSGKSTLGKVLSGTYRAQSGSIFADGLPRDAAWLRANSAVVFQDFARFLLTIRENVGLGSRIAFGDAEAIERAATAAGAHQFVAETPRGYETLLGTLHPSGRELSYGQWQRLAIARALLREAPLLILDEPTASLDPGAERVLIDLLRALRATSAVVLISHRASTVMAADHIYFLDCGRVVEHGTHRDLVREGGHYAHLFGGTITFATASARAQPLHLSEREAQVLGLCARGMTDKEIAQLLMISPTTVRTVLQRLYLREGLRNRTHAVTEYLGQQSHHDETGSALFSRTGARGSDREPSE